MAEMWAISSLLPKLVDEGLSALPVGGDGVPLDDVVLTGAQAVTPLSFVPSWTGTKAELLAQIDADPTVLVDDGPRFAEYLELIIALGHPLSYRGFPYINSYNPVIAVGQRVDLRQFGDGCIVGGPDLDNRLLKIINTSGATVRATDAIIDGLKFNVEKCAAGALNSINCLELSGFRDVLVQNCDMYHGADYQTGGGDAGLFISCQRATVRRNRFQGAPDLGIYVSGSGNGLSDNSTLLVEGNTFLKCSNGVLMKRNFKRTRVIGNHFEGCRNDWGTAATVLDGSTGDGQLAGSVGIATGNVHTNTVASCIDLRDTSTWHVDDVADGTFGQDKDGAQTSNASVVKLDNADGCNINFTYAATSADASHSAVRIQNGSIDNRVTGVVRGAIANGLLETNGDNNSVELKLGTGVTAVGTIFGDKTQYRWDKDGVRGFLIGPYDRLEGRMAYGSTVNTTDTVFNLNTVGRVIKMQPAGSIIKALLPTGVTNGDRGGVIKWTGSGAGQVQIKDPTDTYIIAVLANIGDQVIWSFDGTTYRIESYSYNSRSVTFVETAAASIPSPAANCYTLFFDTGGVLSKKDSAGTVTAI